MVIKLCLSDPDNARAAAVEDLVGAGELYPMVLTWWSSSLAFRRWAAIIGRKRPLFDACRQIYQENFGQGLHSGRRREAPWGRDPCTLVVPLQKLVM